MTRTKDLMWKKKLFPELVRLAWPIAVSMLSYSVMTVVDTLFVGRLGAAALAGVAWGGVVAFTLLCFGIGMVRAIKVQVSQAVGAGQPRQAAEVLSAGIAISVVIGLLALTAARAGADLVRDWSASAAAGELAKNYLLVRSLGSPIVLAGFALREARYGVGDSRSPMNAAIVANLANIPLNACLIFGLGWGVQGAALATVAAQTAELLLLVGSIRKSPLRPGPLRWERCRDVLRTGWPLGLEFFLDVSAFSALAGIIARMGEVQLASHQIAVQLSHFAFLPAMAVGEAASVLGGQAVGANEDRLVLQVATRALLLNLVYVGACNLLMLLGAGAAAALFSPDLDVQQTTAVLIRVSTAIVLAFAFYAVPRATLRAVGSERFAATITVGCAWLYPVPIAYWLGLELGWGALGAWVGLLTEISIGSSVTWWKLGSLTWLPGAERARERLAREWLAVDDEPAPASSAEVALGVVSAP